METTETQLNFFERLNVWLQESISVKLVSIGFMIVLLLLPSALVNELMRERQLRAERVVQEVAGKWSESQTLSGPILVIPYKVKTQTDRGKNGIEIEEHVENYFLLPESLHITGEVKPKELHRGIYDAVVYSSSLHAQAQFTKPDLKSKNIANDMVLWKDASMIFSITDLRGISENPKFTVDGVSVATEPSSDVGIFVRNFFNDYTDSEGNTRPPLPDSKADFSSGGIVAKLGWQSEADFKTSASIDLELKGSDRLFFNPTGKTTTLQLSSPWSSPSFDGSFLPEVREVSDKGFNANWKILHFNRPIAQAWTESNSKLTGSEFGVRFLIPVDQYQKSIRTAKYGHLIIILTFVALFLVEIIKRIKIHPFQYILIAAALIIYYTLLLSFSEQFGYNTAYLMASVATISLICFYSFSFLKDKKLVALFVFLLTLFYSFIFVIVLLQDYSLLIGSVGLFVIIGALMFFARKINWYGEMR
ncbi:MAG: cell envelope integrity protein CreD [Bacteroidetes bacterium]|nr:cell envelope integrity protein CreD [Bacteroidota bacterium]